MATPSVMRTMHADPEPRVYGDEEIDRIWRNAVKTVQQDSARRQTRQLVGLFRRLRSRRESAGPPSAWIGR